MKELDKALELTLHGPEASEALAAMRAQLAAWGLVMPAVEPLVLDFGLGEFPHVGLIETWLANEIEAGYCGKCLFVADGQTCPTHHHRQKHETFFVVKGRVAMTLDGVARAMAEGELLAVPPGVAHRFTGVGPALLLELSTPCVIDDNFFENQDISIGGNYRGRSQR